MLVLLINNYEFLVKQILRQSIWHLCQKKMTKAILSRNLEITFIPNLERLIKPVHEVNPTNGDHSNSPLSLTALWRAVPAAVPMFIRQRAQRGSGFRHPGQLENCATGRRKRKRTIRPGKEIIFLKFWQEIVICRIVW